MRIYTVLKTGGDFKISHVHALKRQLDQFAPFDDFICLSDVNVPGVNTIKLKSQWPGYWAKMELFDPEIKGDFLYMDLDTVILDDISHFEVGKTTLLRDFYRDGVHRSRSLNIVKPEGLGSGLMYLCEKDRGQVWRAFNRAPLNAINLNINLGDQGFLEKYFLNDADRWQDVLPGQVVSWKVHCLAGHIPPSAKIVCMHGTPRPWAVNNFRKLYETA